MKRIGSVLLLATLSIHMGAGLLSALQFGRRFFRQNDPPSTEFVMARWKYGTNGRFGHLGWSHNYPNSEEHINEFFGGVTSVNVDYLSYRIVELSSDEIFKYPFAYVSEPGEMLLTEREVENLRKYMNRGGFVLLDDFDGNDQMANLRQQVQRAFPNREFVPLTVNHPIFGVFYELQDLNAMAPYVQGGNTVYYGLENEHGDIAMIALLNNDLANFWEWIGQPRYPLRPATEAFRMGVNFVLYSMTH